MKKTVVSDADIYAVAHSECVTGSSIPSVASLSNSSSNRGLIAYGRRRALQYRGLAEGSTSIQA